MVSCPKTTLVPIPQIVLEDLEWWSDPVRVSRGVPIRTNPPRLSLFSDASVQGWGATLGSEQVSGVWSPTEQSLHINVLELRAVRLALLHWQESVKGRAVEVFADNTTALAYIRKQGGARSWSLFQ
ncbi:MAG: hypothetical protein AAGM46_28415, partial [Cyanobacteria bacterium J06582_2]